MNFEQKKTNYRWVICGMLFLATTINYMDRQVLSLTWKDFIAPEFHWSDANYGSITAAFSLFYAFISLFSGKFIDWVGTKKGYLIAIFVWSTGAVLHAFSGIITSGILTNNWLVGYDQAKGYIADYMVTGTAPAWFASFVEFLRSLPSWLQWITKLLVSNGTIDAMLAVSTICVWIFIAFRLVLALGEAGNFPAAIKVTAEYFPKKDRALATSIFNSGASVGALVAPVSIPFLARAYGWEMSFIIIGALGFLWMFLWLFVYEKPEKTSRVNKAELTYINQDDVETITEKETETKEKEEKGISLWRCFCLRHTWSYICGKFFTDGVWWFLLFWAPAYFSEMYGYRSDSAMGATLIFLVYIIVTVVSILVGGYLPKYFIERRGMEAYSGRLRAMFFFALLPVFALLAQPLGQVSAWWPAIVIGLAGAGHQAWSANLYSTVGDMFPKSAIATITGIGTMTGGIASFLINQGAGLFFDYSAARGSDFQALGFEGKEAAYMIVFCYCAIAYLIAWACMKTLVPRYKKVEL